MKVISKFFDFFLLLRQEGDGQTRALTEYSAPETNRGGAAACKCLGVVPRREFPDVSFSQGMLIRVGKTVCIPIKGGWW